MIAETSTGRFYGWVVVRGAFVLAALGMGIGFYGPAIYLQAIHETRGWPVAVISAAVTTHFLIGAIVVGNLPALYRRFGIPTVTKTGAFLLALGIIGWANAAAPWQLFAATFVSGAGWVTMGIAAVNAMVSPWFGRDRPAALAVAYNGANVGGIVFSPLWVMAIGVLGFPIAATAVCGIMVLTTWVLARQVLSRTPQQTRLTSEDDPIDTPSALVGSRQDTQSGSLLWYNVRFLTLAAGMALGLFAQIGLTAHLFSLLVPALGTRWSGLAMTLVTAMAIAGRTFIGWMAPVGMDWRLMASASYIGQVAGSVVFIFAAGKSIPLLILGLVLLGVGFGNGTFLPPLIAHEEFAEEDAPRVVSLIVAISQGAYAFAPATFGAILAFAPKGLAAGGAPSFLFATSAFLQMLAAGAFLIGRRRKR
jgi:MFS family permease